MGLLRRRRLWMGRGRRCRRPLLWRALRWLAALFGLLRTAFSGLRNDDRVASVLPSPCERRMRQRRHRDQRGPGEDMRQTVRADARDHSWMLLMNLQQNLRDRLQRFCVRSRTQVRRRVCGARRRASKTAERRNWFRVLLKISIGRPISERAFIAASCALGLNLSDFS
jgi:hypothetical protein